MNNNDLISIIVPVYNVEPYLSKCLNSIINQTYRNLEIILVDDGSTDNSGKICDEYKLNDNRIKVIHQENHGIGFVRNIGLKECTGKFVAFVDSDDYIANDMIYILYNKIIEYGADISCCANYRIERNNNIKISGANFKNKEVFCKNEIFKNYLQGVFGFCLWNKLFKHALIKNMQFSRNRVGEDMIFLTQAFNYAGLVCGCDNALYYYVKRETSLTESMKKSNNKIEIFRVNKQIFEFIKNNKKDCLKIAVNNYVRFLTELYQNIYLKKNSEILKKLIIEEKAVNREEIKSFIDIKGTKKVKVYCLLYCRYLFPVLVIYEKYIGGLEKRIRKWILKLIKEK